MARSTDECLQQHRYAPSWLRQGVRDIRETLLSGLPHASTTAKSDERLFQEMSEFYEAARAGDFGKAVRVCEARLDTGDWTRLVSDCIERLNKDWDLDQLSVMEVAEAFWTTHRVVEQMLGQGVPVQRGTRRTGTMLLCVPDCEMHSFGAQIVADKLRRAGFTVDLALKASNNDVLMKVQAKRYDILGVSVGYDHSLLGLADLIEDARLVSANPTLMVVAGGRSFDGASEAYRFLGADRVLSGAVDPVAEIQSLFQKTRLNDDVCDA